MTLCKIRRALDAFLVSRRLERANVARWVRFQETTLEEFRQLVLAQDVRSPRELAPVHLSSYLQQREKAGDSPQTLHRRATIVRAWARWLEESGSVTACKLARAKLRAPRKVQRLLPAWDELWRLAASMPNPWHNAAARLLLATGCRRWELLGSWWREYRMDAGVLELPEDRTKTGRRRAVPLSPRALDALQDLRALGTPKAQGPFRDHRGDPCINGDALSHAWRRHADRHGMHHVRLHDLRHGFGTGAVTLGVDLVTLQAVMGHECVTTTRQYLHASPDAAQALGAKLAQAGR